MEPAPSTAPRLHHPGRQSGADQSRRARKRRRRRQPSGRQSQQRLGRERVDVLARRRHLGIARLDFAQHIDGKRVSEPVGHDKPHVDLQSVHGGLREPGPCNHQHAAADAGQQRRRAEHQLCRQWTVWSSGGPSGIGQATSALVLTDAACANSAPGVSGDVRVSSPSQTNFAKAVARTLCV